MSIKTALLYPFRSNHFNPVAIAGQVLRNSLFQAIAQNDNFLDFSSLG
jgi:hypothetical protein